MPPGPRKSAQAASPAHWTSTEKGGPGLGGFSGDSWESAQVAPPSVVRQTLVKAPAQPCSGSVKQIDWSGPGALAGVQVAPPSAEATSLPTIVGAPRPGPG